MYVVTISIWGCVYKSQPMTLDQCTQAEAQAKEAYPGINVSIDEVK